MYEVVEVFLQSHALNRMTTLTICNDKWRELFVCFEVVSVGDLLLC